HQRRVPDRRAGAVPARGPYDRGRGHPVARGPPVRRLRGGAPGPSLTCDAQDRPTPAIRTWRDHRWPLAARANRSYRNYHLGPDLCTNGTAAIVSVYQGARHLVHECLFGLRLTATPALATHPAGATP